MPFEFLLATLASWRIAYLLTQEDGPWDMFVGLRRIVAGTMLGRALDCFYCTSVWVAAPFALWVTPFAVRTFMATIVTWLALSGAACLLHRATNRELDVTPLGP